MKVSRIRKQLVKFRKHSFSDFKNNSWVLLIFVGLTMMIKVFATGITLGAGGNGGNFAPSYLWVPILAMCFKINKPHLTQPVSNFTMVVWLVF
jgi:CIC family chloride channel protein